MWRTIPGFADVIQGPWLMEQMQKQAEHVGTRLVADHVSKVDLTPAAVPASNAIPATSISPTPLIVATGAQARWLELPSEQKFKGYGVSACATCDGFFYRGKEVLVIGGGNTAVEEALFLTNFAAKVTVVHRRDQLPRGKDPAGSPVQESENLGDLGHACSRRSSATRTRSRSRGVILRNVKTGAFTERTVDGVFIAIGHTPASELFAGQLEMKPSGYIKTAPFSTATSVPGVFAAGDVTDDVYRQAVTAAGQGCMAALEAERFLAAQGEAEPAVAAE